jgi:hypothetical protein
VEKRKISYSVPNSKKILSLPGCNRGIKIIRGENVAMKCRKINMKAVL